MRGSHSCPLVLFWVDVELLAIHDSRTLDRLPRRAVDPTEDHVDVIFGGIYSSTRQAIKGPAVVNGKKLYIYPEQYEGAGMRSPHLLYRPGAGAAGRAADSLADATDGAEELLS